MSDDRDEGGDNDENSVGEGGSSGSRDKVGRVVVGGRTIHKEGRAAGVVAGRSIVADNVESVVVARRDDARARRHTTAEGRRVCPNDLRPVTTDLIRLASHRVEPEGLLIEPSLHRGVGAGVEPLDAAAAMFSPRLIFQPQ